MFYVIKNSDGQYLDENNQPCTFDKAERYQPHERTVCTLKPGERFVGPCIEGETP